MQSILVWVLEDNPSKKFYEKFNPKIAGEEEIRIAGGIYKEVAYIWSCANKLLRKLEEEVKYFGNDNGL